MDNDKRQKELKRDFLQWQKERDARLAQEAERRALDLEFADEWAELQTELEEKRRQQRIQHEENRRQVFYAHLMINASPDKLAVALAGDQDEGLRGYLVPGTNGGQIYWWPARCAPHRTGELWLEQAGFDLTDAQNVEFHIFEDRIKGRPHPEDGKVFGSAKSTEGLNLLLTHPTLQPHFHTGDLCHNGRPIIIIKGKQRGRITYGAPIA